MRAIGNSFAASRAVWPLILIYAATAMAALLLKDHYSRADADDLVWILAPTAFAVGWLTGLTLERDPGAGWLASGGNFIIAPACAGVNFLILVFALSVVGFVHRMRTPRQRALWLAAAFPAAYLAALAVNVIRILVSVELYASEAHAGWLTAARVHRIAGASIYLIGLWLAWLALEQMSRRFAGSPLGEPAAAGGSGRALVPACYLGGTVVVPLLNGAWQRFGADYVEHAVTVSVLVLAAASLLSWIRWATSGAAAGARPR